MRKIRGKGGAGGGEDWWSVKCVGGIPGIPWLPPLRFGCCFLILIRRTFGQALRYFHVSNYTRNLTQKNVLDCPFFIVMYLLFGFTANVLSIDGFRLSEWVAWLASDQRSSALFGTAYSRLNSHFKQGFNNVIMGMMVLFISMKCTQCNNACSGSEKCLSTYCTKCTVSLHCRTKSIYKKTFFF